MDLKTKLKNFWRLDAQSAKENGFVDAVAEETVFASPVNAAMFRIVDKAEAEKKVQAWYDRQTNQLSRPVKVEEHTSAVHTEGPEHQVGTVQDVQQSEPEVHGAELTAEAETTSLVSAEAEGAATDSSGFSVPEVPENGTPIAQLRRRLGLLMPIEAMIDRKNGGNHHE